MRHGLWQFVSTSIEVHGKRLIVPALVVGFETHVRMPAPVYTVRLLGGREETKVPATAVPPLASAVPFGVSLEQAIESAGVACAAQER